MDSSVEAAEAVVWIDQACQEDNNLIVPSTVINETTPYSAARLFRVGNR